MRWSLVLEGKPVQNHEYTVLISMRLKAAILSMESSLPEPMVKFAQGAFSVQQVSLAICSRGCHGVPLKGQGWNPGTSSGFRTE
jgi:hypothetical protein